MFLLAVILTQDVAKPTTVSLDGPSCLFIDSQALLRALAKHPNTKIFEDYVRTFANTVYKMGATIIGIDATFATLMQLSATNYLIEYSPADKVIVVAGEFVKATTVKWSDQTLSRLEADHEEADSHT